MHHSCMFHWLAVGLVLAVLLGSTGTCQAFMAPLMLGNVTQVSSIACPTGFSPGMSCTSAVVAYCAGTAPLSVVWGVEEPVGDSRGVILLLGSGPGTTPFGTSTYAPNYLGNGFTIVQVAWNSAWEDTGLPSSKNMLSAACRSATLFQYLRTKFASSQPFCGHGHAAGAAQLAYALTWYGGDAWFDKVVLGSGPLFSELSLGCQVPPANAVTVCPTGQTGCNGAAAFSVSPTFGGGAQASVAAWTGNDKCGGTVNTNSNDNGAWKMQSITATGADYSYPETAISFWLCYQPTDNSPAMGQLYVNQILASSTPPASFLQAMVSNCENNQQYWSGTYGGQSGLTASVNDMIDSQNGCVRRHN